MQRTRDLECDRHPATRQAQHDHIVVFRIMSELVCQQATGLGTVLKTIVHRTYEPLESVTPEPPLGC